MSDVAALYAARDLVERPGRVVPFERDLAAARRQPTAAASTGDEDRTQPSEPLRTRGVELARIRPPRFAWAGRVPLGYLSLLLGIEGVGKGTLLAWLAARLSRGELPGDLEGEPVNVLWIGDEDSFDSVVFPRLHAAGADPDRIRTLADGEALADLASSAGALAATIAAEGYRVVVFDQLLDHLGAGLDDWRAKQVRDVLRPLRAIAREHDVAALGALHPNKGAKTTFRELLSGTHAFNALSRSSLLVAPHPEDECRRVLVRGKGNLCPPPASFEFAVQSRSLELNGYGFDAPLVADEREGELDIDELLKGVRPAPVLDELRAAVAAVLTDEEQSRSAIARAVGRKADDRHVGRALDDLEAEGAATKVGRGKWRKFGFGVSKATPNANKANEDRAQAEIDRLEEKWGG